MCLILVSLQIQRHSSVVFWINRISVLKNRLKASEISCTLFVLNLSLFIFIFILIPPNILFLFKLWYSTDFHQSTDYILCVTCNILASWIVNFMCKTHWICYNCIRISDYSDHQYYWYQLNTSSTVVNRIYLFRLKNCI